MYVGQSASDHEPRPLRCIPHTSYVKKDDVVSGGAPTAPQLDTSQTRTQPCFIGIDHHTAIELGTDIVPSATRVKIIVVPKGVSVQVSQSCTVITSKARSHKVRTVASTFYTQHPPLFTSGFRHVVARI